MGALLDYSWPGADADPVGTPFTTPGSTGTFRRVSNAGAVSTANTFSLAYDSTHSAPGDHKSTVYIGTLGGGDFGPAVRINTSTGACYFMQCADAANIQVYVFTGGGFAGVGTISGVAYNAAKRYTLEASGTSPVLLKVYEDDVQIGSTISDSTWLFTGGQPGISGYDGSFRISRVVTADLNAGATPNISSVDNATPRDGSSITLTGTAFGASQGLGYVTLGGAQQTVTAWGDTSITITVSRGLLKYGTQALIVTDNSAVGSNSYNVTFTPPVGWDYINLGAPTSLVPRLQAYPDLTSGDQIAHETVGGAVDVFADGTFVATAGVRQFDWQVWTAADGWGGIATAYIEPAVTNLAQLAAQGAEPARQARRKASSFELKLDQAGAAPLDPLKWFAEELTAGGGAAAALAANATATATTTAALSTAIRLQGAATAQATATAALTTAIRLAATPTAVATASAALTTSITAAAAATATASATAALTTAIQLQGAATATAAATAALTTAPAGLSAAAVSVATATAGLTTGIPLSAAAAGAATASASLTTSIRLAAAGQAAATATAALSTGIQLAATGASTASATAALTTSPQGFAASAASVSTASASLTTGISLQAAASATATAAASLTTAVQLQAAAQAVATTSASLTASGSAWAAAAVARAQASAALTTAIYLRAAAQASASATASLSTASAFVEGNDAIFTVPARSRTFRVSNRPRDWHVTEH